MFSKTLFAGAVFAIALGQVSRSSAQQLPNQQQVRYCYLDVNPHSYACHEWVFNGSPVFPLNIIDWSYIEGEWKTITYANPWSENNGPEFVMMVDSQNQRIPLGVLNKNNQTMMGSLIFKDDRVTWDNWRGTKLKTKLTEYPNSDSYTFKFSFPDGDLYEQSFVCRDFNRNSKHHLTCIWYLIRFSDHYKSSYTYEFRGYFGFIKPSDLGAANPPQWSQPIPVTPPPPPVLAPPPYYLNRF